MNESESSSPESPAKEQPGEQNVREFLERWIGRGHLQTFEDRERFRKEAAVMIEKLGRGWIPVSERLPEDSAGHVLAWRSENLCCYVALYNYADDREWCDAFATKQTLHGITHWMPLPPPPPERP